MKSIKLPLTVLALAAGTLPQAAYADGLQINPYPHGQTANAAPAAAQQGQYMLPGGGPAPGSKSPAAQGVMPVAAIPAQPVVSTPKQPPASVAVASANGVPLNTPEAKAVNLQGTDLYSEIARQMGTTVPGDQEHPAPPPSFPPPQKSAAAISATSSAGEMPTDEDDSADDDQGPGIAPQPAESKSAELSIPGRSLQNMGQPDYKAQPRDMSDLPGASQPAALQAAAPAHVLTVAPQPAQAEMLGSHPPAPPVPDAVLAATSPQQAPPSQAQQPQAPSQLVEGPAAVPVTDAPAQAPAPEPHMISVAVASPAQAAAMAKEASAPPPVLASGNSARWEAPQGADMRDVLASWSSKAGVEFIWNTDKRYAIAGGLAVTGDYDKAVQLLLGQYQRDQMRPIGTIYKDPRNAGRVLVVTSLGK